MAAHVWHGRVISRPTARSQILVLSTPVPPTILPPRHTNTRANTFRISPHTEQARKHTKAGRRGARVEIRTSCTFHLCPYLDAHRSSGGNTNTNGTHTWENSVCRTDNAAGYLFPVGVYLKRTSYSHRVLHVRHVFVLEIITLTITTKYTPYYMALKNRSAYIQPNADFRLKWGVFCNQH